MEKEEEETTSSPASPEKLPEKMSPAIFPARSPEKVEIEEKLSKGVDYYVQAYKALSERSPFDSEEVIATKSANLPSGLASLSLKLWDSRRKHKRGHWDAKKGSGSDKSKSSKANLWVGLEEYFRELGVKDIEMLRRLSESFESVYTCFDASTNAAASVAATCAGIVNVNVDNGNVNVDDGHVVSVSVLDNATTCRDDGINSDSNDKNDHGSDRIVGNLENGNGIIISDGNGNGNGIEKDGEDMVVVKDGVEEVIDADMRVMEEEGRGEVNGEDENDKENGGEFMDIDNGSRDSFVTDEQGPSASTPSCSHSCSSVEWVLGSRNRVLLASTRPTKKRKLSGETAGLERLMVAQPCENSSALCHVCSMGETGDQLNKLVVCNSCNVVVHQKCYGVQGEVDKSWLCSWCKHKNHAGGDPGNDRPCVLCPKLGGAVKRFQRSGGGNFGSDHFAHLFCCQWMPEVYIDDTRLMEPLLSVEGGKDVRGKLVCNLCKIKLGSSIRCSDGSCRSSFHPICAREARNKLEIWGKFGCDDIELRAFCAKHSGGVDIAESVALEKNPQSDTCSVSLGTSNLPVVSGNKIKKLKIGCKNGDKLTLHIGAADSNSSVDALPDSKLHSGLGDPHESSVVEPFQRTLSEDVNTSSFPDLTADLKKLAEQGKVSLEQIASEIGISVDLLTSGLTDNSLGSDVYCKVLKWLGDHSYMDMLHEDSVLKLSFSVPSKGEVRVDDCSGGTGIREMDVSDTVPVKSVPPRRRTVGNIQIIMEDEDEIICNDKLKCDGTPIMHERDQEIVNEDLANSNKDSTADDIEQMMVETIEDSVQEPSPISGSMLQKSNTISDVEIDEAEEGTASGKSSLLDLDHDVPSCSSVNTVGLMGNIESGGVSYVHPYIQKKLNEVQNWLVRRGAVVFDGSSEQKHSDLEHVLFADRKFPVCFGGDDKSDVVSLDRVQKAEEMGLLDLFPESEVEGEIIYSQQLLLANAVARKHHSDCLISKIIRSLPTEVDAQRKQRWDDVLVNQYTYELKQARKQGRKERRHKEAQAVLAAATAAAAASSRLSSLRKDAIDESPNQENQLKMESSRIRSGLSSPMVPRAKDSCSVIVKSDKYSDTYQLAPGSTTENSRSCDVCGRTESLLNPILVCSTCKVAVHLSCYKSVKETAGPWSCELCEELSSSKFSIAAAVDSADVVSPVTECVLCGGLSGAFRKSSNGQWIHAFCAEWVFDSTFKRGQAYPIQVTDMLLKGTDICSVCQRRYGVCIKCNFGNCQATFHPSCARCAGYYMYARNIGGGKMQRKAYCSKHSLEQRAKVENQKQGADDLKVVKQHRVELEKLRLLCERIHKREKLKRELVICSQDILASKRDSLAMSMLVRRPYLSQEVSSGSATTSLNGLTDVSRSCSEAMQKSDEITVDSALSGKRCIRIQLPMDNDQKTDDSSTSQQFPTPKPTDRVSIGGKQIPVRAAMTCHSFQQSGENKLSFKKHSEALEKELLMTSDQAFMKNRRLPKGFVYVPADSLSNGKQAGRGSVEREESDG